MDCNLKWDHFVDIVRWIWSPKLTEVKHQDISFSIVNSWREMLGNSVFNGKKNVRKQKKCTWLNSVPHYPDIVIPVRTRLLVPESQRVEELMLDRGDSVAVGPDGELLLPHVPVSHWRPAAYRRVHRAGRKGVLMTSQARIPGTQGTQLPT